MITLVKASKQFTRGYTAGMRAMLMSINSSGPDDFKKGDDPFKIAHRSVMSKRLQEKILEVTKL